MRVVNPIQLTSKQFETMYWDLARRFAAAACAQKKEGRESMA